MLRPNRAFGGDLSVRKVLRANHKRFQSKMGGSKTSIAEMGDMHRGTLFRVLDTIAGSSVGAVNHGGAYEESETLQFRE